MVNELLKPVFGIIEGIFIGKVEHNDPCLGECEVIIDNSSIPFLSSRVPELEVEGSVGMSDFFESIVNSNGRFLRVELSINIANKEGTFSNGRSSYNDSFIVLKSCVFELTHTLRFYITK